MLACMQLPTCFYRNTGNLKAAARASNDFRLLAVLTQDAVANEVMYHRSCYKNYMNRLRSKNKDETK